MKGYEKYRDSRLDWIGNIPQNWGNTQLKHISSLSKGKKAKEDFQDFKQGTIPYLSMEYLRGQTESPSYVYANDPNIVLVEDKDLLILWDGSKAGEIVKAKKGALSSTMGKIHAESKLFCLNYLTYYLKNAERYIQANTVGMGIPHVSGELLRTLYIPIPLLEEQTKIAQYLDYQTNVIDQLIQQKEKLIELLKEKRQAVINEAVTKGLNPNAKMKDSGIEWLGAVPEGWVVTKMKYGCQFIYDGTHGSFARVDDGFRLLSVRNIIDSKFVFRDDDSRISEKDYVEISSKFEIKEDDIQLAIVGATLGKVAIVEKMPEPFVTQRSLASIRANTQKCLPKYLFYFLSSSSFQSYLWLSTSYSAQPGVYLGTIQKCNLPIPSLAEQVDIISFLEENIDLVDNLISKILIQIEKLKEYRQSIISEAVTGKIDVRDWQPDKQNVA